MFPTPTHRELASIPPNKPIFANDPGGETNLELGMALVQQHINNIDLTDVAMLLKLLTDLGADGGHGEVEGVHCLDFGGLYIDHRSVSKITIEAMVRYSQDWMDVLLGEGGRTARSHSR